MIVVDTNIIAYFYLKTEYSGIAENLYKTESDWVVPLLWRSEFRNVLATFIRRDLLTLTDGLQIFELAESLFFEREYEVNSSQVMHLAFESGCSAYDCEFVSLAMDLNISFVTMDKKILSSFPDITVSLQNYKNEN